jgi:hypothetical protein
MVPSGRGTRDATSLVAAGDSGSPLKNPNPSDGGRVAGMMNAQHRGPSAGLGVGRGRGW